jgi:hypothetical protein
MADRARWLLYTHEGRVTLGALYVIAAIASVITYAVVRSPAYASVQLVILSFGLFWVRWCLKPRPRRP